MERLQILQAAALSVMNKTNPRPPAPEVVSALLQLEQETRHQKHQYPWEQLTGTWRLCLITGTRKARQKAGIIMGAGRYLPSWMKISITYEMNGVPGGDPVLATGKVENRAQAQAVQLCVTGPIKFLGPKNILAFDFTRMQVSFFGLKLYDGWIRGGEKSEAKFLEIPVRDQAFFTYFFVSESVIAARGRGGGLALWTKI